MRCQRFAPLIYRGPVCKHHRSPYEDISACPTYISLTLTCGLSLPAYRMLVTTISPQSRQEIYVSEQDTSEELQAASQQPTNTDAIHQSQPHQAISGTENPRYLLYLVQSQLVFGLFIFTPVLSGMTQRFTGFLFPSC